MIPGSGAGCGSLAGHEDRHCGGHRPGRWRHAAGAGGAQLPGGAGAAVRLGPLGGAHPAVARRARSRSRTRPPPTTRGWTSCSSRPVRAPRRSWPPGSPPPARSCIDNSSALRMDPRGAAGRRRGQPARRRRTARRASSPTRTAPRWPRCRCCARCTPRRELVSLVVATYQAVSGAGLAGVAELDEQVRKVAERRHRADLRRRRGGVPRAALVRPADRVQRAAAGRLDRRRRLGGDRRGAEAAQREPQDPGDSRI